MYDYIIVGGGSAGCVLANRLSENSSHKVLLLEAGPSDNNPLIKAPLGIAGLYQHPKLNWGFWSQAEPTQNNRKIYCPQGKTLGGGSAINGMLYVRGNPWDYNNWEQLGNEWRIWNTLSGWGFNAVRHGMASKFDTEQYCDLSRLVSTTNSSSTFVICTFRCEQTNVATSTRVQCSGIFKKF